MKQNTKIMTFILAWKLFSIDIKKLDTYFILDNMFVISVIEIPQFIELNWSSWNTTERP